MNGIRIIALMALLNAVLAKAGDYTGTNNMPEQIHNLMETEGYAFDQNHFGLQMQSTNLLGNLQFFERRQFIPFVLPAKKVHWSLWTNSKFKYVGRNTDQINLLSPSAALAQYEYDISYSWVF
jgi:hypothetical protein